MNRRETEKTNKPFSSGLPSLSLSGVVVVVSDLCLICNLFLPIHLSFWKSGICVLMPSTHDSLHAHFSFSNGAVCLVKLVFDSLSYFVHTSVNAIYLFKLNDVSMYSFHTWQIKTNGICAMNPFSFGMAHSSRLLNHLNSFSCFSLSFHFGLQSICPCTKYTHSFYTEKCLFWTSKWEQMRANGDWERDEKRENRENASNGNWAYWSVAKVQDIWAFKTAGKIEKLK